MAAVLRRHDPDAWTPARADHALREWGAVYRGGLPGYGLPLDYAELSGGTHDELLAADVETVVVEAKRRRSRYWTIADVCYLRGWQEGACADAVGLPLRTYQREKAAMLRWVAARLHQLDFSGGRM